MARYEPRRSGTSGTHASFGTGILSCCLKKAQWVKRSFRKSIITSINKQLLSILGLFSNALLSNWYPAPFKDDGVRYCCAEQHIMRQKAAMFGDGASDLK